MNRLKGKVVEIVSSENVSMVKVDVDGDILSSIVLEGTRGDINYKAKDIVTVLFKETEVGIAKDLTGMISLRNRFKAIVIKIDKGIVLSKLTLAYNDYKIESVISTQSVREMKIKEGEVVEWLVKTNEMSLMKDPA